MSEIADLERRLKELEREREIIEERLKRLRVQSRVMQKKYFLIVAVVILSACTIFIWPGNSVSFHEMSFQAPSGWVMRAFEDELRVEPRVGLWGQGLVKVTIDLCESKAPDELKDAIRRTRIYSEPEIRSINGREWIFAFSKRGDPNNFLAYGKISGGRCLKIMGEPENIVSHVMNQVSPAQ